MPMRFPKYFGRRVGLEAGETNTLHMVPVWSGESLLTLKGVVKVVSDESVDLKTPIDFNMYGLHIPWDLWYTHSGENYGFDSTGSDTDYDKFFERLLIDSESVGSSSFYGGGDPDVPSSHQEAMSDADTDAGGGPTPEVDDPRQTDAFRGPTRVTRWFSTETLLGIGGSDASNKGRHVGTWNLSAGGLGPGIIMLGCRRYPIQDQDYIAFWPNTDEARADAQVARAILIGQDMSRVKYLIKLATHGTADWLRTQLFEGDTYNPNGSVTQPGLDVAVKMTAVIDTPYDYVLF